MLTDKGFPRFSKLAIALAKLARRGTKEVEAIAPTRATEIIERQSLEESLPENQSQLQDFLENANILIQSVSLEDGRLLYMNRAWCETLGYSQHECHHLTIFHLIHPTQLNHCREMFKSLSAGRESLKVEMIFLAKDGSAIALEGSLNCQHENGTPKAATGIFRDITKRKRAEQRLEAQYITARVLAESATLEDATPKILQAICDSLGWDVGELWSVNHQTNVLNFVNVWYQPSVEVPEFEALTRNITFASGVGLPGRIWASGKPAWIADVVKDTNFLRATVADKAGLHGAFGFPILGSKEVLGVLTFLSREIRQPDNDLLEMVIAIGRQMGQFIERKQAKEALELQRQWLEVTLSSIGDAVIATDTKAAITFMNPVAEALTGWTQEDAVGQKIDAVFHIIHEQTRAAAEIPVERVLQEGVVVELAENTALIARDGTEIPIDDSCAPIRDKSGTLQGAVLIFRDITKRQQAAQALQKSEKQYRSVVNNVKDVIFQTDAAGVWTFLNPAWTEITGFSLKESLGTNVLNYVHPDDRQLNLELFQPLITRQKDYYRHEIRYLTKDGSVRWIEVFARLTLDTNDEIIGTSGTLHDITDRKRAEEEIRKALAQEKELNELKSRFISMTSHEFRTPLTTALSSAELLEHYGHKWGDEKKLSHLHRIQGTVQHLTRLLDDVLLIGKADAGKIEFNPAPIALEQFCLALVEELQLNASHQHTISFVSNAQCTKACMDEKLLHHIFGNLLSNAIKYSPTGGTVHFKLTCQDGEAIFQIQDEGIGIPKEDQKRLFESFHRATNVGKIQGTGLGLAIVKRSVDLHGGKIVVNSAVGVGTTFTVTLPLIQH
jgi:PAS domain S-box-containing protein